MKLAQSVRNLFACILKRECDRNIRIFFSADLHIRMNKIVQRRSLLRRRNALRNLSGRITDALKAMGLPFDQELIVEGDYRIESGYRAGHALLSHRPDGIYVANHLMTVGLLKAAEEMRLRCPEDFGLVSFDDYPWLGIFRPRLTTVELPKHQLGSEAAELLITRIAGDRSKPVLRKLQPELRIRESCGFADHVSRLPSVDVVPTQGTVLETLK